MEKVFEEEGLAGAISMADFPLDMVSAGGGGGCAGQPGRIGRLQKRRRPFLMTCLVTA